MVQSLSELLDALFANADKQGDKDVAQVLSRLTSELQQSEPNLYTCRKEIARYAHRLARRCDLPVIEQEVKLHYLAAATMDNQAKWAETGACDLCSGYGVVPGPRGTFCVCPACDGPAMCGRPCHSGDITLDPLSDMLYHIGRGQVAYRLGTPDGSTVPVLFMGEDGKEATQAWVGIDPEGKVVACGCSGEVPCGIVREWEWSHALSTSFDLLNGFQIIAP